jgi:Kef-type K+ transport system membrane component KefB
MTSLHRIGLGSKGIEQDIILEEISSIHFIRVIISLSILLFAAKLFAELFHRLKLPVVLGELLAGIIAGPFAVGGLIFFSNEPLVELDETVLTIGEISAIVILFIAGLEITPREFLRGEAAKSNETQHKLQYSCCFSFHICHIVILFFRNTIQKI